MKVEIFLWCSIILFIVVFAKNGDGDIIYRDPIIEAKIIQIVKCESGKNPYQWGDCDKSGIKNGNHCKAWGVAQFHKGTFYEMTAKMGFSWGRWESMDNQITVLRWAIEHGYSYHWTCASPITLAKVHQKHITKHKPTGKTKHTIEVDPLYDLSMIDA